LAHFLFLGLTVPGITHTLGPRLGNIYKILLPRIRAISLAWHYTIPELVEEIPRVKIDEAPLSLHFDSSRTVPSSGLTMRPSLLNLAGLWSLSLASASGNSAVEANHPRNAAAIPLERDAKLNPAISRNTTIQTRFFRFLHHFDTRQEVGRCGPTAGGASCSGNQCCSTFDYCGTDAEYWRHVLNFLVDG
jgi:hypothetical protein